MEDKRKHKRFAVEGMDIHGKIMFTSRVEILDISLGGISLKTDKRLNIGSEYTLKIEDKGRVLLFKGTVIWSSLSTSKKGLHGESIPIYKAGLKFNDVLTDKITELLEFINVHKKTDEFRLSGIRFHIHFPERALLNYPQNYIVKKLSLGGMLIETTQELQAEKLLPMELIFPEDKEPVKLSGRVASCLETPAKIPKRFDIGIEFIDMSEKDKERLKGFMRLITDINGITSAIKNDTEQK